MLNFHRPTAGSLLSSYNPQNVKRSSSTVDSESPTGQVVASIYCRLDEASKKKARLVCREWKRVMEKYFFRFTVVLNDTSYPFILNATVSRLDTLIVQDFSRETDHHRSLLSCPTMNLIFRQCHTSSATPRRSVSESNMEKILWQCSDVKTLIFEENSLRFIRHLAIDGLQFRNLTHLMITLRNRKFDVNEGGHHVLLQLSRIKMPVLSSLRLDSLLLSGDKENAIMYASIFEFAAVHSSMIKNLAIRHSFQPYSNLLNGSTTATTEELNLPWKQSKFDSVRQDMSNLALTNLTLFLDKYEGLGQFTLALDLLASQYYLSKLEIHMSNSPSLDSNNRIHDLYSHVQRSIERNLGTLRHLSLSRCDIESPVGDLGKILRAAYHCSDLESVRLFVFSMPTFPHQLPPTIRSLELMGTLSGGLLAEIRVTLPALEHLQFANLTDDYLKQSQQGGDQDKGEQGESLMMLNLKKLLSMHRRLCVIKWHCPKLDMNFISNMRGVSVKTSTSNAFASIITIHRNM